MDPLKTGQIICEARKKLDMTQKDLANKLFVSDKAVSKWERGLCFPDISVLIPLTEILKISLYDLLKGEKMNKEEIEETLKDTINYSNSEMNKKKNRYIIISLMSILIVILACIGVIIYNNNSTLSGIVDRDTIYGIDYYKDYKTSLQNEDGNLIETLLGRLSLSWVERTFSLQDSKIVINYSENFDSVVKAYNDELYVKLAIINNSTILFTTVSDLEIVKVQFNDYSYTVKKDDILKAYSISSIEEISDENEWSKIVSEKLVKKNFVNTTFKEIFTKEKVTKSKFINK